MKNLLGIITMCLFFAVACRDASSVVAPDEGTKLDKYEEIQEFNKIEQDSVLIKAPGDPIIPRI